MRIRSIYLTIILALISSNIYGQASLDFLRSTGKIYAVALGIVIIFLFIVFYLVRLDRKLSKLENESSNE